MAWCIWCAEERTTMSDWEQERLQGGWFRLCKPCARARLDNPLNALLPMRKVESVDVGEL